MEIRLVFMGFIQWGKFCALGKLCPIRRPGRLFTARVMGILAEYDSLADWHRSAPGMSITTAAPAAA